MKRTGYVSVSLPPGTFSLVAQYAKALGKSKARFIADLVDEHDAAERATAELLSADELEIELDPGVMVRVPEVSR
ncbi:MAG TPA: hypothetical protein VLZ09_00405 [Gaiellaceae bacterium]|nr:hypothetical protein [Gaiellaceae bacterium]